MGEEYISEGDLAEIVGRSHYHHIVKIESGKEIQSHKGILKMDDLIGLRWGSTVKSHNGNTFFILQPDRAFHSFQPHCGGQIPPRKQNDKNRRGGDQQTRRRCGLQHTVFLLFFAHVN